MSVKTLNPRAETMGQTAALFMNINAAKGLLDVMKTNFGPKGTIKMLVGGSGDIKLTKDGNVLLREMQIQNPTAVMIARAAVAQDDVTGDGTTSVVLLIGELLRQAERYLSEGAHPRVIVEGFDIAKSALVEFLDAFKTPVDFAALGNGSAGGVPAADAEAAAKQRELLRCVARTSLRTKLQEALADQLTDIVTDAVLTIRRPDEPLDLYMVEIMHMRHKLDQDTRLVKGLVLDHGARHPDMPKRLDGGVHVLACNLSLEFERPEVNAGFFYGSAEQREKLVSAERAYTDARCQKIIDLKNAVCKPGEGFCVINMKGIDPPCLDMLAKEGILALRRAKRRNMERLSLAFGGHAVSAEEDLSAEALGFAGKVYEHVLGEDKYTFVEEAREPRSCTVLIKGPNDHTIAMIKDAVRDGLRAVKNALDDGAVVAGAGAFEIAAAHHLRAHAKKRAQGRAKLGVEAFAEALLGSVKILAENAGYDAQESVIKLQEEFEAQGGEDGGDGGKAGGGAKVGLDLSTGEACDPATAGVYDNALVKRQVLNSAPVVASQLLLVDEVMRAGINMRR